MRYVLHISCRAVWERAMLEAKRLGFRFPGGGRPLQVEPPSEWPVTLWLCAAPWRELPELHVTHEPDPQGPDIHPITLFQLQRMTRDALLQERAA